MGPAKGFSQSWDRSKRNIGQKYRGMHITEQTAQKYVPGFSPLNNKSSLTLLQRSSGTASPLSKGHVILKLQNSPRPRFIPESDVLIVPLQIHCWKTQRETCVWLQMPLTLHINDQWDTSLITNSLFKDYRASGLASIQGSVLGVYDWKWWCASGLSYCCCIYDWYDISR